jgi:hypothetical protein
MIVKGIRFSSKEKREFAQAFALAVMKVVQYVLDGDWYSAQKNWTQVEMQKCSMIDAISLSRKSARAFVEIFAFFRSEVFAVRHNATFLILLWNKLMQESDLGQSTAYEALDSNLILDTKADHQLMEKQTQMINEFEYWQRQGNPEE